MGSGSGSSGEATVGWGSTAARGSTADRWRPAEWSSSQLVKERPQARQRFVPDLERGAAGGAGAGAQEPFERRVERAPRQIPALVAAVDLPRAQDRRELGDPRPGWILGHEGVEDLQRAVDVALVQQEQRAVEPRGLVAVAAAAVPLACRAALGAGAPVLQPVPVQDPKHLRRAAVAHEEGGGVELGDPGIELLRGQRFAELGPVAGEQLVGLPRAVQAHQQPQPGLAQMRDVAPLAVAHGEGAGFGPVDAHVVSEAGQVHGGRVS